MDQTALRVLGGISDGIGYRLSTGGDRICAMTRARPVVRVIASDPEPSAGSLPWRRSKGALAWVEAWPLAHWAGVERLRRQLARFSFRAPGQGAIVAPHGERHHPPQRAA